MLEFISYKCTAITTLQAYAGQINYLRVFHYYSAILRSFNAILLGIMYCGTSGELPCTVRISVYVSVLFMCVRGHEVRFVCGLCTYVGSNEVQNSRLRV
jgi:hypothetical protein